MVVEGVTGAVGEVEEEDQGVVRPAEEAGTREGLPVRARIARSDPSHAISHRSYGGSGEGGYKNGYQGGSWSLTWLLCAVMRTFLCRTPLISLLLMTSAHLGHAASYVDSGPWFRTVPLGLPIQLYRPVISTPITKTHGIRVSFNILCSTTTDALLLQKSHH